MPEAHIVTIIKEFFKLLLLNLDAKHCLNQMIFQMYFRSIAVIVNDYERAKIIPIH